MHAGAPAPFHGEPEPLAIAQTEALGEVLQSSGDSGDEALTSPLGRYTANTLDRIPWNGRLRHQDPSC